MTEPNPPRPTIPEQYLREIDGRLLANRGALEELTGLSKASLNRAAGGADFPQPVVARGPERRSWYEPDDLVDWALAYEPPHELGYDSELAAEFGERLLSPREAAALIQVRFPGTFNRYVQMSEHEWRNGRHGILPILDEEQPRGTKQVSRRWKTSTLIDHQERRPARGGRPEGSK
jgi:hypothetical protein